MLSDYDYLIRKRICNCGDRHCKGYGFQVEIWSLKERRLLTDFGGYMWHGEGGAIWRVTRYYRNTIIPHIKEMEYRSKQPCLWNMTEPVIGQPTSPTASLSGTSPAATSGS